MAINILLVLATVGSGLLAGVFFAFSSFVMPALSRVPTPIGVASMQRINVDVFHWSFMGIFFLTPAICLWLAIHSVMHWGAPSSPGILAGSISFLLGCFLVTAAGNVPLNNAIADLDPEAQSTQTIWRRFIRLWTRWNHVRTLCCAATAGLFVVALSS